MNQPKRETFGAIWRLCQQMEYSAENALTETLKAQFLALQKQMAKLDTINEYIKEA